MKNLIGLLSLCLVMGLVLNLVPLASSPRQARIDAGTGKGAVEVRFALPEFQSKSADANVAKLTALFNQVVWDDLDFSGSIALINRTLYPLGKFQAPGDIKVENWTDPRVNAQYIAFGSMEVRSGKLNIEAHLWDLAVAADRERGLSLGSELSEDAVRLAAHRFADHIVDTLFGGKVGISQTRIAYVSVTSTGNKEVMVMDYDGANAYPLTTFRSTSIIPSWAPDGEKVAFITYRRNNGPNIEILSRLDRSSFPFQALGGTTATPAWSPDGSKIAFSSGVEPGNMEIYVADWNGRNAKRLTVNRKVVDISPTWNPATGRELAFVSDRSGTQQILIMDADGTNVHPMMSEGGDAENPSWSPDGRYIAFAWQKRDVGRYDIYIHDLATGRNTQLTSNAGDNERPSWAPDGRHFVFASTRSGTSQIYSMLANGEKLRQLTKTGRNEGPAWSTFSGK